ncbi:phosphoesterase [Bifidobacterium avesanii]|nr:phosphoesterase [Bifidobacterium avesanii]
MSDAAAGLDSGVKPDSGMQSAPGVQSASGSLPEAPKPTFAPLDVPDPRLVDRPVVRPGAEPTSRRASRFSRASRASRFSRVAAEPSAPDILESDPFLGRPRVSSRVIAAVLGVLLLAASAGVWWLAVRTAAGQQLDDMVLGAFGGTVPGWIAGRGAVGALLKSSALMIGVAAAMGVGGLAVALLRRRWWLAGQTVGFAVVAYAAARLLKELLPRETLVRTVVTESGAPLTNTAPSGHMALTIAAGLVLLCAVPRAFRALVAVAAGAWSALVGALLIANGWHRPSDIVMAYLLVGGLALIALAFTRGSGMDRPGTRVSSVSVQVAASVLITAGAVACLYAAYVVWQFVPSLDVGPEWMAAPACATAKVAIAGCAALVFGLALALRQLTAAPLSKMGLVGAPPAPPQK